MTWISDLDAPGALLISLTAVTAVLLIVLLSTSSTAFGAYNPTWDGTSTLRDEASTVAEDPVIVTNVSEYRETDPSSSVALVLSPARSYGSGEAETVQQFVRAGGTLIVADDFGTGTNQLLTDIGAQTRIDGRPLRDGEEFYRSPALPVATGVQPHPLTGGASRLTLNHATALRPNGALVLARTSPYAYLDANRNETLDSSENLGRYPVVTTERLGQGRLVVVSDPSLFINAMIDRDDNREFVGALLADHQTVLLDYSHTGEIPPLTAFQISLQDSPMLRLMLGLVGVLGVALVGSRYAE
ncbi:DUF4350 domain-containing protein [Halomicroarcula sp. GCM10025817]|uniref:DUF4350 domain-containing protein n=1 Tax=Haloarcula TaxID=2237 RepID=UPI0023E81020|nr:DUF4350 domain-containing protein [Halomicroarcula sp. SYNS111]